MNNNVLNERIMADFLDYASIFRMKLIIEFVKPLDGKMAIDIGCGRGSISFLLWFLGARTHSVDISAGALQQTKSIRRLDKCSALFQPNLCQGDAIRLPFREEIFDIVCCLETLGLLPDDRTAIEEIERVVKPGGTVILAVPYDNRAVGKEQKLEYNRRYSFKSLKDLLHNGQLHPERVVFWRFPVLELLDRIKVRNAFVALGLLVDTLSNKSSILPRFRNYRNNEKFVYFLVRFYRTGFWRRVALPILLLTLSANRFFRNLPYSNMRKGSTDVFLVLRKTV
jgi:ubiquinone/menaquinone biosynthesis C-methylase UbiE